MHEDGTRHEVKLLHVGILGVLSGLIVNHVGGFALHNQQVHDAAPPYVLIEETAWFVACVRLADTQLKLGVLLAREVS